MNASPPTAFFEKLPSRSDQELLSVLAHKEDYLPEAVEAVISELRKRGNLAEMEAMAGATKAVETLVVARAKNTPLHWALKVVIFLAGAWNGLSLFQLAIVEIIAGVFWVRKNTKKVRDIQISYLAGACVWVAWNTRSVWLK
jgi:hypothetical protein